MELLTACCNPVSLSECKSISVIITNRLSVYCIECCYKNGPDGSCEFTGHVIKNTIVHCFAHGCCKAVHSSKFYIRTGNESAQYIHTASYSKDDLHSFGAYHLCQFPEPGIIEVIASNICSECQIADGTCVNTAVSIDLSDNGFCSGGTLVICSLTAKVYHSRQHTCCAENMHIHIIGNAAAEHAKGCHSLINVVRSHFIPCLKLDVQRRSDGTDIVFIIFVFFILISCQGTGSHGIIDASCITLLNLRRTVKTGERDNCFAIIDYKVVNSTFFSGGIRKLVRIDELHIIRLGNILCIIGAEGKGFGGRCIRNKHADLHTSGCLG